MQNNPFKDFQDVIRSFMDALPLLWKNQLWKGYFSHGPVSYLSIFLVLAISYKTYSFFHPEPLDNIKSEVKQTALNTIKNLAKSELGDAVADSIEKEIEEEGFNAKISLDKDSLEKGIVAMSVNTDSPHQKNKDTLVTEADAESDTLESATDAEKEGEDTGIDKQISKSHIDEKSIFSGGSKYLSIILLNMLIAHFCGRIIGMMGGFEKKIGIKSYFQSQFRVIQVGIFNWGLEIAVGIIVSIFCGMFLNDDFEKAGKVLLQMFFLGYLFFDSYNDYFDLKINESRQNILRHLLPVTMTGAIAYALMSIPYAGGIIGPIICSVAVTLYLAREKGLYLKKAPLSE